MMNYYKTPLKNSNINYGELYTPLNNSNNNYDEL